MVRFYRQSTDRLSSPKNRIRLEGKCKAAGVGDIGERIEVGMARSSIWRAGQTVKHLVVKREIDRVMSAASKRCVANTAWRDRRCLARL